MAIKSKKELLVRLSDLARMPQSQVKRVIDALATLIEKELKKGEKVMIPNFGIFGVKERAKRKGRNPKTGEIIEIPARKVVYFKPSKKLKEEIANS
jgi:DNA-binding protein HU-beta